MRYLLFLGVIPGPWSKRPQAERVKIKEANEKWFADLASAGSLQHDIQFGTWKHARTITLQDGEFRDVAGPLIVGEANGRQGVLVALAIVDARSLTAAVRLAKTWPMPDAVVEVRPIDKEDDRSTEN